jgi:beta-glucosidase
MIDRLDALVDQLSLEEQASLTAGRDFWTLPSIERLGIAALKFSDGPSGVRGAEMGTRRSLAFPCGLGVGSTWDLELVERFGRALGDEARSKGVHVVLGPTIGLPRSPLGGRTFESFSEDPHLTSRVTVAYVEGVQSRGVAACAKHFAMNDQETDRTSIDVKVDERALREVHLAPFEAAVREAGIWSVMGAYNRVGGIHCCEHDQLLGGVLKAEWAFDGVVISDWTATRSTVAAARAGLDVEMPGPPSFLGAHLADAVERGEVDREVVRDHALRVLRLAQRCGALDGVDPGPEREEDDPARRALARDLAAAGSVLLRNEGDLLPLDGGAIARLALIGPGAVALEFGGGGSSEVMPLRRPTIADELRSRLPDVELIVEEGCSIDRDLPPAAMALFEDGLTVELFADDDWASAPAATRRLDRSTYFMVGEAASGTDVSSISARVTGTFVPDRGGNWKLGLSTIAPSSLLLDGVLIADIRVPAPGSRLFGLGSEVVYSEVVLVEGRRYELQLEMQASESFLAGFELIAERPLNPHMMERAVAAARRADVAVVVVGSNRQWETEGADRADLRLVGRQDELVAAVAAANPRTVVVLNNGGPVEMPWLDDVATVLNVWYPGEEGPGAVADMLLGSAEPSGRLPVTYPRRLADTAQATSPSWFPGVDGCVVYGEGLLIGYRHHDVHDIAPLFAFGHGLSYTTFELGEPTVEGSAPQFVVSVPVTNLGRRRGQHVVQVYVEPAQQEDGRPIRHLGGFAKVLVEPGATTSARIEIGPEAFRRWEGGVWVLRPGTYQLRIGASSRDLVTSAAVSI